MKKILRFAALAAVCLMLIMALSACKKEEDPNAKPTVYAYPTGDAFVTNIVGSKKMLKCSVSFEVTDEKFATAAADTNAIVRNAVIKVLVLLTEDEVLGRTGSVEDGTAAVSADLDAIEQKLTDAANEALETDVFYSAIITEFTAN